MRALRHRAPVSAPLADRIFVAAMDRLCARAEELGSLVASGYSFEEWLNWEIFLACRAVPAWDVSPYPSYAALGAPATGVADLLVRDRGSGCAVVLETSLVYDHTDAEWAWTLDADAEKLRTTFMEHVLPMQLVVCASAVDAPTDDSWCRWLPTVPAWNRPYAIERTIELPHSGLVLARAWTEREPGA